MNPTPLTFELAGVAHIRGAGGNWLRRGPQERRQPGRYLGRMLKDPFSEHWLPNDSDEHGESLQWGSGRYFHPGYGKRCLVRSVYQ